MKLAEGRTKLHHGVGNLSAPQWRDSLVNLQESNHHLADMMMVVAKNEFLGLTLQLPPAG